MPTNEASVAKRLRRRATALLPGGERLSQRGELVLRVGGRGDELPEEGERRGSRVERWVEAVGVQQHLARLHAQPSGAELRHDAQERWRRLGGQGGQQWSERMPTGSPRVAQEAQGEPKGGPREPKGAQEKSKAGSMESAEEQRLVELWVLPSNGVSKRGRGPPYKIGAPL